ncbi:phytanoyl-CoA dioxygenase family protein [soil metagenome]
MFALSVWRGFESRYANEMRQEFIDQYHNDGYALVPNLISAGEAAALRQEMHDLAANLSKNHKIDATWGSAMGAVAAPEKTVILHCHNVQFYSAAVTKLICDPRMTDYAAAMMGSENVQLHHSKMFIKPPEKGSPFPMHQDAPFFKHDNDSMMAVIFFFDDAPLEKGCLRVVPGSHKLGMLEHIGDGGWHLPYEQYPVENALPLPAKAGDAVFFNYLTIHGSGINVSEEARTTILVQMRDPLDKPSTNDGHASRGQGMMLRGVDPNPHPKVLESM